MLIQDEHGNQSLELLLKEQYQENQQKIEEISKKQAQIKHLQKNKVVVCCINQSLWHYRYYEKRK